MDIERAVEDFVGKGKDLFRRLRSKGESVEAAHLKSKRLTANRTNGKQCTVQVDACAHGRAIDNYIDEHGNRTKLFYCLECGAVIEDPSAAS